MSSPNRVFLKKNRFLPPIPHSYALCPLRHSLFLSSTFDIRFSPAPAFPAKTPSQIALTGQVFNFLLERQPKTSYYYSIYFWFCASGRGLEGFLKGLFHRIFGKSECDENRDRLSSNYVTNGNRSIWCWRRYGDWH